ncbi:MAG TPA: NAD-binding protein, partial [Enterovirga sp.]|nr:NAD-binding protein [Enterovirga sp.]
MPPEPERDHAGPLSSRGEPLFDRVALVGIGLIGSSIARAARAANLTPTIIAIDRDPAVVARVRELGIADEATTDLAAGVVNADLVILSI